MLHCGGRASLTGHCGHGWTCSLPCPLRLTRGNHRSAPSKRACSSPGSARSSCRHSCRLLILIAAPFSSRLSRYKSRTVGNKSLIELQDQALPARCLDITTALLLRRGGCRPVRSWDCAAFGSTKMSKFLIWLIAHLRFFVP